MPRGRVIYRRVMGMAESRGYSPSRKRQCGAFNSLMGRQAGVASRESVSRWSRPRPGSHPGGEGEGIM